MAVCGAILTLGLSAYLGAHIFGSFEQSLRTAAVRPAAVTLGGSAKGLIFRDELLLTSDSAVTALLAVEGRRVGRGDGLAETESGRLGAGAAGLFSAETDGYEHLAPEKLDKLQLTELRELMDSEPQPGGNAYGKLVLGSEWCFAAEVQGDTAALLQSGQKVTLDFGFAVEGEVLRISEEGLAVFLMDSHLAESLPLRMAEAEIIIHEYYGLRLPSGAVNENSDGNIFVSVLTAGQRENKTVNIIYEGSDWLLAEMENRADALREGNIVILPSI